MYYIYFFINFRSLKNPMADNNVIFISIKAIMTLFHCHNHALSETWKTCSFSSHSIEKDLNYIHFNEPYSSDSGSSSSKLSIKDNNYDTSPEILEEIIELNKFEPDTIVIGDNIQKNSVDNDDFELSDEFDKYIIVEYVDTDNLLNYDNENGIYQLLSD